MLNGNKVRKLYLLIGDTTLLYASLFLALTVRYASFPSTETWRSHLLPFTIINILWVAIFYISGFYDTTDKKSTNFISVAKLMTIAGIAAALLFYLIPTFGIAPKTNLLADTFFAFILILAWRNLFFNIASKSSKIKIYFFGREINEISDFVNFITKHPQLGYTYTNDINASDIVVLHESAKQNPETVQLLYKMTLEGKTIIGFDKFYESITGKIPILLISETWFLENLMELDKQAFEKLKRLTDILFSLILLTPLVIISPLVALLIKTTSKGPVFYRQKRTGKNGVVFELIKFRSMILNAEAEKTGWAKPDKKDNRVTFVGNILRKTRIDELPQVWNVIRGEMSFIGPRPERPKFVQELIKDVPYYSMRHLIKPGVTGWSQINFGDASAKDAYKKLQYDLYYIKNRSLFLDTVIILKTIAEVLGHSGK